VPFILLAKQGNVLIFVVFNKHQQIVFLAWSEWLLPVANVINLFSAVMHCHSMVKPWNLWNNCLSLNIMTVAVNCHVLWHRMAVFLNAMLSNTTAVF
jgi:hypothetical protein